VHARGIEAQFNLAERSIGAEKSRPVFRLGIVNTLPLSLTSAIAHATARLDAAKVELVEGRARDLTERLNMTRIDAALTLLQPGSGRFAADALHTEGYSLALPESHMLASRSEIEAEELSDNIMIVRRQCEVLAETSRHFTTRGVRPFFAARTMNDDRALGYVAAGLGITVMPDCFAAPGVRRVPLADFSPSRTLAFVQRDDSEAGQALRDVMRTVFSAAGLLHPDGLGQSAF
jgi:DNA-binding transcriptional LysR family regulator